MTITGTCYFITKSKAVKYYALQGETLEDVERKLHEGIIFTGKPPLKPNQRLILIDHGLRYGIQEE